MRHQVALAHYDVEEHGTQTGVLVLLVVIDEDILQFIEFRRHMAVVDGEFVDSEIGFRVVVEQTFHVTEYDVVLIFHMLLHLLHIVVEEFHEHQGDIVGLVAVYSLDQMVAYLGHRDIEE